MCLELRQVGHVIVKILLIGLCEYLSAIFFSVSWKPAWIRQFIWHWMACQACLMQCVNKCVTKEIYHPNLLCS